MKLARPLCFHARNRKGSITIHTTRCHFKSCRQHRLFPSPDHAPWELWESTPLRLVPAAYIPAGAEAEPVSARGPRILRKTFEQNFVLATRMLLQMHKSFCQRCCRQYSSMFL